MTAVRNNPNVVSDNASGWGLEITNQVLRSNRKVRDMATADEL